MLVHRVMECRVIDDEATGKAHRELREAAGVPARHVAREMRYSAPAISLLECGKKRWTAALSLRYRRAVARIASRKQVSRRRVLA